MISGSDSTKLFDGYVEFEDQLEDEFGELDSSKPMEREELESLTKKALMQQEMEANHVSPEMKRKIDAKAKKIASIIFEWVYLAADSGDWEFRYDMNQVDQIYLVPTVHEVRRMFPGTYIKYSFSSKNRWIEVNWSSSSEC
jgi:hypothetical protein